MNRKDLNSGQPSAPAPDALAAQCAQEWQTSAEIRNEFLDLGSYTAFRRAESAGRVKIFGQSK